MGRVIHFEIHADDPDRAEAFYRSVLGWDVRAWEGAGDDYRLVTTGPPDRPGIDGAIMPRYEGLSTVCTAEVEDLAATGAAIAERGGARLADPQEIPGVGTVAYFTDTEGNCFGALQPARAAREAEGALHSGDRVLLESESPARPARRGRVAEVVRAAPPRYRIRWDDGHESVYTPAAGARHRELAGDG
jgi:predicted enzyme related to lactoylglutathione lyase